MLNLILANCLVLAGKLKDLRAKLATAEAALVEARAERDEAVVTAGDLKGERDEAVMKATELEAKLKELADTFDPSANG